MTLNTYNQKGFFQIVLVGFLIILVSFITNRYMPFFVGESGNLNIIDPQAGILLAAGLVLKWKYIRLILVFWILISLLLVIVEIFVMGKEFLLPNLLLSLGLAIILYFLFFSDPLKTYVENTGGNEQNQ